VPRVTPSSSSSSAAMESQDMQIEVEITAEQPDVQLAKEVPH
jgi:hypothetical protein